VYDCVCGCVSFTIACTSACIGACTSARTVRVRVRVRMRVFCHIEFCQIYTKFNITKYAHSYTHWTRSGTRIRSLHAPIYAVVHAVVKDTQSYTHPYTRFFSACTGPRFLAGICFHRGSSQLCTCDVKILSATASQSFELADTERIMRRTILVRVVRRHMTLLCLRINIPALLHTSAQ
jgi:hypothetical protein